MKFLYALLVVIFTFIILIVFYNESKLSNSVTIRNISISNSEYNMPYNTHGGIVYLNKKESDELNLYRNISTALGILALVSIPIAAYKNRRKR